MQTSGDRDRGMQWFRGHPCVMRSGTTVTAAAGVGIDTASSRSDTRDEIRMPGTLDGAMDPERGDRAFVQRTRGPPASLAALRATR